MAVPAWWMSITVVCCLLSVVSFWMALNITSESSELDMFSNTKLGYSACNNNNRLVSDLEPVIFNRRLRVAGCGLQVNFKSII